MEKNGRGPRNQRKHIQNPPIWLNGKILTVMVRMQCVRTRVFFQCTSCDLCGHFEYNKPMFFDNKYFGPLQDQQIFRLSVQGVRCVFCGKIILLASQLCKATVRKYSMLLLYRSYLKAGQQMDLVSGHVWSTLSGQVK